MIPRLHTLAAAGALLACAGATSAQASSVGPAGDPTKGKTVFTQQCALCHSAAAGQEGQAPSLYGVVGRKAASEPGFPAYSTPLKSSKLTWTRVNLEKFLSGPTTMVPGTAMPVSLGSPRDRRDVVAYLASLKKAR
jgi:cytochrome c2